MSIVTYLCMADAADDDTGVGKISTSSESSQDAGSWALTAGPFTPAVAFDAPAAATAANVELVHNDTSDVLALIPNYLNNKNQLKALQKAVAVSNLIPTEKNAEGKKNIFPRYTEEDMNRLINIYANDTTPVCHYSLCDKAYKPPVCRYANGTPVYTVDFCARKHDHTPCIKLAGKIDEAGEPIDYFTFKLHWAFVDGYDAHVLYLKHA